jgi:hypothetical protein
VVELDYQRVRRILQQEFKAAMQRRDLVLAHFNELNRDIPSGLPSPDGSLRIKIASRENQKAMMDVARAARRLTVFQVSGIIPDDLE